MSEPSRQELALWVERVATQETEARASSTPRWYSPHLPHPPQAKFLELQCKEALYGGAAGGGKSDALLMAAQQYIHIPNYHAIIFRRTYADLALPGAIMDRSKAWFSGTDARWSEATKTWTFPSGATISFGYLETEVDKYRYQGSEFQFIAFDELTQFTETQYTYLFSRLRSTSDIKVPLRMRAASNPGGVGHIWVKRRFIDSDTRRSDSVFVPAKVRDNPSLNADEYIHSLNYLDPITRARYLEGDWTVSDGGKKFKREWFEIVETLPVHLLKVCYWDLAATEANGENDPDYTAGCVIGKSSEDIYYVTSMIRTRSTPRVVEALVKQTAQLNGVDCSYVMEQEPGSSGVNTIDYYTRIMAGYWLSPNKTTGSKSDRANPFASQAEAGNVKLLKGSWNADFLDELEIFPEGPHDDQVDAASGAFEFCAKRQWMSVYDRLANRDSVALPQSPDDGYNLERDEPLDAMDGFRSRGM